MSLAVQQSNNPNNQQEKPDISSSILTSWHQKVRNQLIINEKCIIAKRTESCNELVNMVT